MDVHGPPLTNQILKKLKGLSFSNVLQSFWERYTCQGEHYLRFAPNPR